MPERFNHAWRIVGTAVSFAAFGLGGLLLGLLVFPLLRLFVRDPVRQGRFARALIQRSFAGHVGLMHRLGVLSYELHGLERLDRRGLLVLANHPTLIDVVFLVSLIPQADCVVKARLLANPFTRGPVKATGYICNHSGAGLVEDCIRTVHSGRNLVIFPEGTRAAPGAVLPLSQPAPFYALVELATPRPNAGLRESLESVLEAAMEAGSVTDAAIAESDAQRAAMHRALLALLLILRELHQLQLTE